MENTKNISNRPHNMILENREKMTVSGVEHVTSFNTTLIILVTVQGNIAIKGENLDIKKLNLDDGNLAIEGYVNSIIYTDKEDITSKGAGFFGKMFK